MNEPHNPLTPPDCDLRGMQFMPLDVVRLIDSDLVALSTGEEFKAAVILWCKSWNQIPAASLPDDDRILAHLSGAGSKWKKVRTVALRGWIKCNDGRLYHPVIAEKAIEAMASREAHNETKQNELMRKKREREDRVFMFEQLRNIGKVMPFGTKTGALRDMCKSSGLPTSSHELVTVTSDELPASSHELVTVTSDGQECDCHGQVTAMTGTGTGTGTVIKTSTSQPDAHTHTREAHTREAHTREAHTREAHTREAHTREAFAMRIGWNPSPHVADQAAQAIVAITPAIQQEFVSFWMTKPGTERTQAEWDRALLQAALHRKAVAAGKLPPGKPPPERFEERDYGEGVQAL